MRALTTLHNPWRAPALLAPFDGSVTSAMLEQVRAYLPRLDTVRSQPSDLQPGSWPFDAYGQPAALA